MEYFKETDSYGDSVEIIYRKGITYLEISDNVDDLSVALHKEQVEKLINYLTKILEYGD